KSRSPADPCAWMSVNATVCRMRSAWIRRDYSTACVPARAESNRLGLYSLGQIQRVRSAAPARVTVRLSKGVCLGALQPGCRRAGCDLSGDWPLRACLGNDLSACARRRWSGTRCWLDQELVRRLGVTHHSPAAVSLAQSR